MNTNTPRRRVLRPAALALTLGLIACGHPTIVGRWSGRDETGTPVVYAFARDGSGSLVIHGIQQSFTYEMIAGYPNLLRLTSGGAGGPETREGLVELREEGRMRLELGPPGGPPPEQLSEGALELRRPATR